MVRHIESNGEGLFSVREHGHKTWREEADVMFVVLASIDINQDISWLRETDTYSCQFYQCPMFP